MSHAAGPFEPQILLPCHMPPTLDPGSDSDSAPPCYGLATVQRLGLRSLSFSTEPPAVGNRQLRHNEQEESRAKLAQQYTGTFFPCYPDMADGVIGHVIDDTRGGYNAP